MLGEDVDEQAVFGGVDTLGQRFEGVVGVDRHGDGAEDRAVVDALVGHEVDHHPGRRALTAAGLLPRPGDGVRAGQLARAAPGGG